MATGTVAVTQVHRIVRCNAAVGPAPGRCARGGSTVVGAGFSLALKPESGGLENCIQACYEIMMEGSTRR